MKYIIQLVYVCVSVDEELQSEDELDKELLWNLQLLSEVREGHTPKNVMRLTDYNSTRLYCESRNSCLL